MSHSLMKSALSWMNTLREPMLRQLICLGATVGCVVAAGGKVVPSLPQSPFSLGDVVIVGACVASTVGEVVDTGVLVGKSQPLSFR